MIGWKHIKEFLAIRKLDPRAADRSRANGEGSIEDDGETVDGDRPDRHELAEARLFLWGLPPI